MMQKDIKTLLSELEKIRKDLDAVKTSQATIAEQVTIIATNTTPAAAGEG